MSGTPHPRVLVRQHPVDGTRFFFDFDGAAPGGRGGASLRFDLARGLVSIDGVHKNSNLPPRSTGILLADGLRQAGMAKPLILEAFNVAAITAATLTAGGNGQGTVIGNLLQDAARALGASITCWEPVQDGRSWHLRIHLSFP
jgi:hypothetical protein